jgi:hypothetical protein
LVGRTILDANPLTKRVEIAQGLRWLRAHRLLHALAVLVGLMNLASMAGQAILVLFAQEQLGLGSVAYGLLLALGYEHRSSSAPPSSLSRRWWPYRPSTTEPLRSPGKRTWRMEARVSADAIADAEPRVSGACRACLLLDHCLRRARRLQAP